MYTHTNTHKAHNLMPKHLLVLLITKSKVNINLRMKAIKKYPLFLLKRKYQCILNRELPYHF